MKRSVMFYLIGGLFLFSSIGVAQTADNQQPAPPPVMAPPVPSPPQPPVPPSKITPPAQTAEPSGERLVSLDFDNVDLPVMVKFISELTGKNFVIDEQVRGKVTIFSPVKIPTSKAYDVFLSVLEMKGFTVIQTGAVYQILPFAASPPSRTMHLYTLQNTVAEEVSQVLTSLVSRATQPMRPKSKNSDEISGQVQIITDKTTNQLIITASDDDYQIIEKTLKGLDKKRRQVYVEAVVMEMGEDKSREIGSDLSAIFGVAPTQHLSILGALNGDLSGATALLGTTAAAGATTGGTTAITNAFTNFGVRPINAKTFLHALQTSKDVNVLSTPQILTSDKQKAEISVAQNVPFPGATNNIAGGTQTVTIDRKDVGVILRLTPTVMENSQVKLDLYQEISSVLGSDDKLGPTTAKRSANTTVVVHDGQTAVIGGLLGDDVVVTERKVPLLGDIPILGYFFKFRTKSVKKTNLLIFVTPYLVPDSDDKNGLDAIRKKKTQEGLDLLHEKAERTLIGENKLEKPFFQQEKFLNGLIMINPPK